MRAPIAINGMLCDLWFLKRGNVLGITFAFLYRFFDRCLTLRATLKGVCFEMIHLFWLDAGDPFLFKYSNGVGFSLGP